MAELIDHCPVRALAVYAHPDDPDISCGGTLARWAQAGSAINVVICAKGDKGTADPEADPAAVAERRAKEAKRATAILGAAGLDVLGLPDGEFDNDVALRSELVKLIRAYRPEVVVCPDPTAIFFGSHHYNHRDHRTVGFAALDAAAPASSSPLYFSDCGPPHQVSVVLLSGSLQPNVWVDIGATIELKLRAVACHESQLADANDWFASALRDGAAEAGRSAGVAYAEAFRGLWLE